ALVEPLAQPLDACDISLRVAPLAARGPVGLQDLVALLPLPERVGRNARPPREGGDVEAGGHLSAGACPTRVGLCQKATRFTGRRSACRCSQGSRSEERRVGKEGGQRRGGAAGAARVDGDIVAESE